MSIQNEIDWFLGDEGKHLRTITINEKSGDATLPDNCYLHLRKCNVGNLEVGRNCIVVIEESSLTGNLIMEQGGSLTMDRVNCTGNIEVTNTKLTQKKCIFRGLVILKSNSNLEAYSNTRETGNPTLQLFNGSSAILSDEIISNCPIGILLDSGSYLTTRNCEIRADEIGIQASGSGQIEIFGGVLYGESKYAYYADGFIQARLVNLGEPLYGNITAVYSDNYSQTQIINCKEIYSDNFCVVCDNNSRTEITNFTKIQSTSISIKSEHGSTVIIAKGEGVTSDESDCIYVNEAKFEARQIQYLRSTMSNCFYSKDSEVILRDITEEIHGYKLRGIFSDGNDRYEIYNCPLVQGEEEPAIEGKSNSTFTLKNVDLVYSELAGAIKLQNSCIVEAVNVGEIFGVEGDGVHCGDDAIITLTNVGKIKAGGFAGIKGGSNSNVNGIGVNEVRAWDGDGISLGSGSSLDFQKFGTIESVANGDAINADSTKVVLKDGKEVLGTIGGGVIVEGSGGSVYARNVELIFGVEGDGVRVNGGIIEIINVDKVEGGGRGIGFIDGTRGSVSGVEKILGGEGGIKASGGASAFIQNTDEIVGLGQPGVISEDKSSVEIVGDIVISGTPESLKVTTNSKIIGTSLECNNRWLVEGGSFLELSDSSTKEDLLMANSSVNINNVDIDKKITMSGSTANFKNTSVGETVTANNSEIHGMSFDVTGVFNMISCSVIVLGSSAQAYSVLSTSIYLGGCSGAIDYTTGVVINSKKSSDLVTMANITTVMNGVSFNTVYL